MNTLARWNAHPHAHSHAHPHAHRPVHHAQHAQHAHRRALHHWASGLLWMLPLLFVALVASLAVTL